MNSDESEPVRLLRQMTWIRVLERTIVELGQRKPPAVVGSVHPCAGQEAIAVGAMAGLRADDQVVATYRGHGWALASGLSAHEVLAEVCHRAAGVNGGRGGSA